MTDAHGQIARLHPFLCFSVLRWCTEAGVWRRMWRRWEWILHSCLRLAQVWAAPLKVLYLQQLMQKQWLWTDENKPSASEICFNLLKSAWTQNKHSYFTCVKVLRIKTRPFCVRKTQTPVWDRLVCTRPWERTWWTSRLKAATGLRCKTNSHLSGLTHYNKLSVITGLSSI